MINRITYSVVFPTNGLALEGDFKPQPGITAVVGPNEAGKTFSTIEVTRYLLFGKKALRGPASDYKKLVAEGEFTFKGHNYTIARSAKKETLTDAVGNVLATGAEEVTNKVIDLLGYDLKVFDIANASVQKNADFFGKLTPTERKNIIDQVTNLIDQEKVEKALRAEGTALAREAEAMTRVLVAPERPVKPVGYMKSHDLSTEYEVGRTKLETKNRLEAVIAAVEEPVKPDVRRPTEDELRDEELKRRSYFDYLGNKESLERDVLPLSVVPYTEDKLEAAAKRLEIMALKSNELQCPHCHEKFVPGHDHIELPDGPDLTASEIRAARRTLSDWERSEEAKTALAELEVVEDNRELLANMNGAEEEWASYDKAVLAYAKAQAAKDELATLVDVPTEDELSYIASRMTESLIYEKAETEYHSAKNSYDESSAKIKEVSRRATAYKDGAKALQDARGSVKAYLAPAISAASSNLMHQMTNGKHSVITVDEEMEVTVGTQSLETLSGGAATVANLALRLALGQVLVADAFPVFLGDEMDSDADSARRETVADAMQTLVSRGLLKQVLLITHRGVDIADHVLSLGNVEE